jgi:hypothetical protein
MLASWTLLNLIKVSIKNKGLLSSAGQNSTRCPGSGAENLKQLCFLELLNFFVFKAPSNVFFPFSQP